MNDIKKTDKTAPELIEQNKKKQDIKQTIRKIRTLTKNERQLAVIGVSLILLILSWFLIKKSIMISASALMDSYSSSYESVKDDTYQKYYEEYYNKAKKDYQVSNRGTISIGNIKEIGKLEVLEVSDVEFVVENNSNNSNGITSWLEVPGKGTFVVNLEEAEFIIDNDKAHVLVRVPYPELTNVTIDYSNVEKRLFKNNLFNNSYRIGEDLAKKQLGEGDALIKKEFASNEHYYKNAQNAGISTIKSLVRQLNPDETNLEVDVEYY